MKMFLIENSQNQWEYNLGREAEQLKIFNLHALNSEIFIIYLLMCFSKKKPKPADQPPQNPPQVNEPKTPENVDNSRVGGSKVGGSRVGGSKKSVLHSKMEDLKKSHVSVKEIKDEQVEDLFENCKAERVELFKTTKEHNSYVRKENYFDLSNDQVNVETHPDAQLSYANYSTPAADEIITPPVYRYFYDQDAWNILNDPSKI